MKWLRALYGLNTHDDSYRLSVSGGVTTALVLPGSANAIGTSQPTESVNTTLNMKLFPGGQGAVIKLRPTAERSPTSLLLENPYSINITEYNPSKGLRWRQMKYVSCNTQVLAQASSSCSVCALDMLVVRAGA